jgi:hypothetical protein
MISHPIEKWADEIRAIYRSDPSDAETSIERYVDEIFERLPTSQKRAVLDELRHQFKSPGSGTTSLSNREEEPFVHLCSLLLGEKISVEDLHSEALVGRLAASLNRVFDTLNQIVNGIHGALLGEKGEIETIRQIIGADLQRGFEGDSLQTYLDQIQEAFRVAHEAFQQAARTKVGEILSELDPRSIAAQAEGGLKFGPLRKAELFGIYQEKYETCKGSFESGRLMNDLLREFEKICQKIYKTKTRGIQ